MPSDFDTERENAELRDQLDRYADWLALVADAIRINCQSYHDWPCDEDMCRLTERPLL